MLHSCYVLWYTICIVLVAAHQNFPLQTEKWKSSTKQLIWLNPTSYWLTPWMKKLHLPNPLCLAFGWQKTGNTGNKMTEEYQWLLPAPWFFNNIAKYVQEMSQGGLVMPLNFQSSRVIPPWSWVLFMTLWSLCLVLSNTLHYLCFPFLFMWG